MNSSSSRLNRIPENGSIESVATIQVPQVSFDKHQKCKTQNAFDLGCVGLSSTFAIVIFIVIGHVIRNVAGPSTILSVLLAALIAFLVGMATGI